MESLNVGRDNTSVPLYSYKLSDTIKTCVLLADTQKSVAVPTGARRAVIKANDYIYASLSPIAALPTSNDFVDYTAELEPGTWELEVTAGQTIYVRARNACDVQVLYYT